MGIGRRDFVMGSVGAAAVSRFATGCDSGASGGGDAVFSHGVASFDPLTDGVILWTRVQTERDAVEVQWIVARDRSLREVVQDGAAMALAEADHTVRVEVAQLAPGTTYYYRFSLGSGERSVVGRTRTLPSDDVDHVRLAFTSCSNFNNGFFHAYRNIAARADLDVWIHLGDYIYEYADGVYGDATLGRTLDPPHETVSLADYRRRYALYRADPDLQEIHRQHACILVWDDHEFADNAYQDGAKNHQPAEGDWAERKRAAAQAFLEWLPMRVEGAGLPPRIYRAFPFGKLFDLIMLDTRITGRDIQTQVQDEQEDLNRQILGEDQERWLFSQLDTSRERGASWRLIGNQIIFAPVSLVPLELAEDFWEGYRAARKRVMDHLVENGVDNVVFLTGDIHTSWAAEVPHDPATYDPETGASNVAVEVIGPSVTSLGLEEDRTLADNIGVLLMVNPHFKFSEVESKGYVLVDVTQSRVQAEWYFIGDHKQNTPEAGEEGLYRAYSCASGSAQLVEEMQATPSREGPAPAP